MSEKEAIYVELSKKPLGECSTYLRSLADVVKGKTVVLEHVSIDLLAPLIVELENALVTQRGFSQTERLQAADKKRDRRISAIGLFMRALASFEDKNQQDAKDLLLVLDGYGVSKIRSAAYSEETAKIRSLIHRLNESPNIEKLAKFSMLSDWLTLLEEDNDAFEAILNEKASEIKADYESCTSIRDRIIPHYRSFIKGINAHAFIGTDLEFEKFIDEHNAQVAVQHLN